MATPRVGRGESLREPVEPWRPKVLRVSEETKLALEELNAISSWESLVRACGEQRVRRERRGF